MLTEITSGVCYEPVHRPAPQHQPNPPSITVTDVSAVQVPPPPVWGEPTCSGCRATACAACEPRPGASSQSPRPWAAGTPSPGSPWELPPAPGSPSRPLVEADERKKVRAEPWFTRRTLPGGQNERTLTLMMAATSFLIRERSKVNLHIWGRNKRTKVRCEHVASQWSRL